MSSTSPPGAPAIKLYGANWCPDTRAARNFLESLGVAYQYIDIDRNRQAAEWVRAHGGGRQVTPTLDIQGTVLVNPPAPRLEDALRASGIVS